MPPFEPWSGFDAVGTRVSASGQLLVDDQDEKTGQQFRPPVSRQAGEAAGQEQEQGDFSEMAGERWGGAPRYSSAAQQRRCHMDLTQKGMLRGMSARNCVVAGRGGLNPSLGGRSFSILAWPGLHSALCRPDGARSGDCRFAPASRFLPCFFAF